jgi:predicted CoA-binding protein
MVVSTVDPEDVLKRYRVIAVVGASRSPEKDANTVPTYLIEHGYTIVPINPASEEILGRKSYPSLLSLPDEVASSLEVVEVFRPSEELPEIARQASEMKKKYGRPFIFWAQLGLYNEEAKKILEEAKIDYVMDACMRIVHKLIS